MKRGETFEYDSPMWWIITTIALTVVISALELINIRSRYFPFDRVKWFISFPLLSSAALFGYYTVHQWHKLALVGKVTFYSMLSTLILWPLAITFSYIFPPTVTVTLNLTTFVLLVFSSILLLSVAIRELFMQRRQGDDE